MKNHKLFVKMIPIACLALLLLSTIVYTNKHSSMQQKTTLETQQTVGELSENTLSQPNYNTDNHLVRLTSEKEQYLPTKKTEVNQQAEFKQDQVKKITEGNPSKDITNGVRSISQSSVSDAPSLDGYNLNNITEATSIDDLQSTHPYKDNEDHLWVYQDEGKPALIITFDSQTEIEYYSDHIYLYDKNNVCIGTYTSDQLSGKTITVWGDTIKIRLCSDGSVTEYGFKVTNIDMPQVYEEYSIVCEELPSIWCIGDTIYKTLKLEKKYIEDGVAKTKELTDNVNFIWKADSSSAAENMDVKIVGNNVTLSAKKNGTVTGYIEAYEGSSTTPIAVSKRYNFSVVPLVQNDDFLSSNSILVNQIQSRNLESILVRGVRADAIVTNVVSSDPTIVSVVKNGIMSGCSFSVKGVKPGKADITVYYTVKDGEKVINASSTYNFNCKEANYDCSTEQNGIPLSTLCPMQTTEIRFELEKAYYDSNNNHSGYREVDPSHYTIEILPNESNKTLIETRSEQGKVIVKALSKGSGELEYAIKIDGQVVYKDTLSFSIKEEQYLISYNGPKELYPNQIVKGPTLIHYVYEDGTLKQQVIEDAVITCTSNGVITYKDGNLVAEDVSYQSDYVNFTCNYNDVTYEMEDWFKVSIPEITSKNMYIGEKVKLSLDPFPVIENDCNITWSVNNSNSNMTDQCATIETNVDGTATLTCIKVGTIDVKATMKRGEEVLWTSDGTFSIMQGVSSIFLDGGIIRVNQRNYLEAYDFRINNTFYNTNITSIQSSDSSIVEVVNYTKYKYTDYNYYHINVIGKKEGDATVTVHYTYLNEDGMLVAGTETADVRVDGTYYECSLVMDRNTGMPGESIPLSVKAFRTGYDSNGDYYNKPVDLSELKVEYLISDESVATENNGILTFNDNASTGYFVYVTPRITVNNKSYKGDEQKYTVTSSYNKIQGVADGIIYIKEGETKELNLELYQYDRENKQGKQVEDVVFLWNNSDQSNLNSETLTNSYFSTNGRSITGKKMGSEQVTLVASYQDENDTTTYVTNSITIRVVPKAIPVLELGQKEAISPPNKYFVVTPDKSGAYKIACSNDNSYPLIELFDQDWKKIASYNNTDSENGEYFYVRVNLEAGKTYFVRASSTSTWSSWYSYTMVIESAMVTKNINDCNIQLSAQQFIYNGKEQKPIITIKDGYYTLKEDTDYLIFESGDMSSAGSYTLSIQGIGKYLGSIKKTCVIQPCTLTDAMVQPYEFQVVFNGKAQKPELILMNGKVALTKGTDYDVYYKGDFTAKGTHKITILGSGNYTGALTKSLDIKDKLDITLCPAKLSKDSIKYSGLVEKPTVVIMNGSYALKKDVDYKIEYVGDFKSGGTHMVKISGVGIYEGIITKQFTITKASQTLAFVKSAISKKYGDQPFINALTASSVKTVTYTSSNTMVAKVDTKGMVTIVGGGKATITAVFAGNQNYNGMKASYTLTVAKINNSITAGNVVKTASSKAQVFTLTVSRKGNATLSYTSNNKGVVVKAGKVTIAKNFVGTAVITITAASNSNYNAISKKITITVNPTGTKVTSLKNQSKNKFLLKWSSNKLVSGYEIQYASNKSFSKATKKTITKSSTTSYQASKLKKKTTYYVRIRTYKIVNKVKYYSGWSKVTYVKIKQ